MFAVTLSNRIQTKEFQPAALISKSGILWIIVPDGISVQLLCRMDIVIVFMQQQLCLHRKRKEIRTRAAAFIQQALQIWVNQ